MSSVLPLFGRPVRHYRVTFRGGMLCALYQLGGAQRYGGGGPRGHRGRLRTGEDAHVDDPGEPADEAGEDSEVL